GVGVAAKADRHGDPHRPVVPADLDDRQVEGVLCRAADYVAGGCVVPGRWAGKLAWRHIIRRP
ncbi:MAG: hypothetical protein ACREQ5_29535, partial [Candidatus Dormibacteria bacterium]